MASSQQVRPSRQLMKGLAATELDRTAIMVKSGDLWEIRFWNRVTGDGPIGPRLTRGDEYPDIPARAAERDEAEAHRVKWQEWLDNQPARKFKKR
jgi:hypothetical protein